MALPVDPFLCLAEAIRTILGSDSDVTERILIANVVPENSLGERTVEGGCMTFAIRGNFDDQYGRGEGTVTLTVESVKGPQTAGEVLNHAVKLLTPRAFNLVSPVKVRVGLFKEIPGSGERNTAALGFGDRGAAQTVCKFLFIKE